MWFYSNFSPLKGDIVYYYNNMKKVRENDVTLGHVTNVTSGYITSSHVISGVVTSGSITFPNYDGLQALNTVKYCSNP